VISMSNGQKIADLNKNLSKHAYSDAVEAISRVACFTTSRNLQFLGRGEYYTIAEELFRKDLLVLGISVRRLAELTKSQNMLQSRTIKILTHQNDQVTERIDTCWNLIGNIVHGLEIEIYKDLGRWALRMGNIDFHTYWEATEESDAAISIKSDKHGYKSLKMSDFLVKINSYVEEANEVLSDNGIYVGSTWNT